VIVLLTVLTLVSKMPWFRSLMRHVKQGLVGIVKKSS
jgi:hypothetical protein